jgi:hypothetical protein
MLGGDDVDDGKDSAHDAERGKDLCASHVAGSPLYVHPVVRGR